MIKIREMKTEEWTRDAEYRLSELEKKNALGELQDADKNEFDKLNEVREHFLKRGLQALNDGIPVNFNDNISDSESIPQEINVKSSKRKLIIMSIVVFTLLVATFIILTLLDPHAWDDNNNHISINVRDRNTTKIT